MLFSVANAKCMFIYFRANHQFICRQMHLIRVSDCQCFRSRSYLFAVAHCARCKHRVSQMQWMNWLGSCFASYETCSSFSQSIRVKPDIYVSICTMKMWCTFRLRCNAIHDLHRNEANNHRSENIFHWKWLLFLYRKRDFSSNVPKIV